MDRKKVYCSSILAIALASFSGVAFSNVNTTSSGSDALKTQAISAGNAFMQSKLHDSSMPEWLQRTDFNIGLAEHYAPIYELTTIQPLFQGAANTWFIQGHVSHQSSDETYNLGFGWRYLTESQNWMPGVNVFYDMSGKYNHQRAGIGGELFGKYMTLRANYYQALTSKKTVSTIDGLNTYQQALNGVDYSVETPVPYLPWVSFTAEGYNWFGRDKASIKGGALFFRTAVLRNLLIELGFDTSSGVETTKKLFMNFTFNFGAPASTEYSAVDSLVSKTGFTARDVAAHRLEKVRRNNQIIVETTGDAASTSNGAFIVKRGT